MERTRHSRALTKFLWALTRPYVRHRLQPIWVKDLAAVKEKLDSKLPILYLSNHMSWYDGFLVRRIHQALRQSDSIYFVMKESEIPNLPFATRIGAIPLANHPSRDTFREIERLRSTHAQNFALMYFPQGRIAPSFQRPYNFMRGIELLQKQLHPIQIVPIGLHIEPMTTPRPQAFVSLGAPIFGPVTAAEAEGQVSKCTDCIFDSLSKHGELFPELRSADWTQLKW